MFSDHVQFYFDLCKLLYWDRLTLCIELQGIIPPNLYNDAQALPPTHTNPSPRKNEKKPGKQTGQKIFATFFFLRYILLISSFREMFFVNFDNDAQAL